MWIPQHTVLDMEGWGGYRPTPKLKLSAGVLYDFLSHRQLKSFDIGWEDCCWEATRQMTDSGRAFKPLGDNDMLEKLRITNGVFDDVHDLVNCLSPILKTLELPDLTLGEIGSTWSSEQTDELVSAVSSLSNLVRLRFEDCDFYNSHLERLLSNLPNLRALILTGRFGESCGRPGGSHITDEGCNVIARCCPNLQVLDLSDQKKATASGAKTILEECHHLRELCVSDEQLSARDITRLISLSSTLLLFGRFRRLQGDSLKEAIIASGGRTLLIHDFTGLVELSGLASSISKKAAESRKMLDDATEKQKDPLVHNEWDDLF